MFEELESNVLVRTIIVIGLVAAFMVAVSMLVESIASSAPSIFPAQSNSVSSSFQKPLSGRAALSTRVVALYQRVTTSDADVLMLNLEESPLVYSSKAPAIVTTRGPLPLPSLAESDETVAAGAPHIENDSKEHKFTEATAVKPDSPPSRYIEYRSKSFQFTQLVHCEYGVGPHHDKSMNDCSDHTTSFYWTKLAPIDRLNPPSLCPDGVTYGYSDWTSLRLAIDEANARWNEWQSVQELYFDAISDYEVAMASDTLHQLIEDNQNDFQANHANEAARAVNADYTERQHLPPIAPPPDYVPPEPFVLCPRITLKPFPTVTATTLAKSAYRALFGGLWTSLWTRPTDLVTRNNIANDSKSLVGSTISRKQRSQRHTNKSSTNSKLLGGRREVTTDDPWIMQPNSIHIDAEDIVIECDGCAVHLGGTHLSFGPNARGVVVRGVTFAGATTGSLAFHHDGAEVNFEDCYWIGNSGGGSAGAVADVNSSSSVSFHRCELSGGRQARHVGNARVASSLTLLRG